jgi:glycerophosphoryl diester phosphodiesterase
MHSRSPTVVGAARARSHASRGHTVLVLCLVGSVVLLAAVTARADEVWVGTAPFCSAGPDDCARRGMDFVRSDRRGDGSRCVSGAKVLCRNRPSLQTPSGGASLREEWVGTAPFCQGHPDDCAQRGMDYVRSDNRGDGAACVSGRKVLCRQRSQSQGLFVRREWVGTAPACNAQPGDCTDRGMVYIRHDDRGNGAKCVTGTKVECGCPQRSPAEIRPFWAIAHRENSPNEVRSALAAGANGIEIDVRYHAQTDRYCVNHDPTGLANPCNEMTAFLRALVPIAQHYSQQWSLLIVDWKSTSPDGAASRLFALIRKHLTDHAPNLGILVTTARWDDRGRFAGLANLRPTEGVGIDEDNDPVSVSRYFHDLGLPHAYGNGVTAALPEGIFAPKVAGSVATALQLRRQNGLARLVYVWTLADQTSMRNYLAIGVDAIFVNRAGVLAGLSDLLHVVRNSCFPVRIATSADRPFAPTTVRAAPVMPPRNVPARPAR